MKNYQKVIAAIVGVSAFYMGSMYTFARIGMVGYEMAQAQRGADNEWMPVVGQSYTFTDTTHNKTFTGTVSTIGPNYRVPAGYSSCVSEPLRCVDNSTLPSCSAGADVGWCDSVSDRIDLFTPSSRATLTQWHANGTILAPTIVTTPGGRGSLPSLKQNEALAVWGGLGGMSGGGPNGPPEGNSKLTGVTEIQNGDYILDYEIDFPDGSVGFYSVAVGGVI